MRTAGMVELLRLLVPEADMREQVIMEAQIEDDFEGFDDEMLFQLTNGTFWLQDEYRYWYYYAYRPRVELVRDGGPIFLRVKGRVEKVRVRQISVIQSRIDGEFNGWHGDSVYTLQNGQVWQQDSYKYEYKYSYCPEVVVFDGEAGTMMNVDGTSAHVRRIR